MDAPNFYFSCGNLAAILMFLHYVLSMSQSFTGELKKTATCVSFCLQIFATNFFSSFGLLKFKYSI